MIERIPLQAEPPVHLSARESLPTVRAREAAGWVLLLLAVVATLIVGTSPSPYSLELPGSTADTLGTAELSDGSEVDLIHIEGAEVYASDGQLSLVTVGVLGSPDHPVSWLDVLGAWFRPGVTASPMEQFYPAGSTTEDVAAEGAAQMEISQRNAVAAALGALDIPYTTVVEILTVLDDGPAAGILEPGDVLVTLDGEAVPSTARLRELLDAHGSGTPAALVVERGEGQVAVEITPEAFEDDGDRPVLGVLVSGAYDFPYEVTIQLENVGGPSAGLMFALGIYDRLTPGSLPGEADIAGTGTISAEGVVGGIGGVRQKMHAALRDGAEWFLVPSANCADAVVAAPAGLTVIPVATFDEAVDAIETIAAGAEQESGESAAPAVIAQELPTCSV